MSSIGQARRPVDQPTSSGGQWRRIAVRVPNLRPETSAIFVVVAIVLLANLPFLAGLTDPNPLGPRSLLGASSPGFISGATTLDPNDGFTAQALGHLAATDLLHGRLPWWNQYEGVGAPLLAEGQSAAFFPPTLLLAFSNGQFWEHLLLELVAGLSTFLLLRRLSIGRTASVAGAVAFALNGTFTWLANAPFNPVAFLPMLMLGLELARSAVLAGRRGGWWLIAVALALSLYAGHPETEYLDGLFCLAWLIWRCFDLADRRHASRLLTKAAAGAVGGLLLAAPILVPFLTALSHEALAFHGGYEATLHLPGLALPQVLLPYIYGPPLAFADPAGQLTGIWGREGGFLGFALVLLALVGLALPRRRVLKSWLVIWIVLALGRMFGVPVLGSVFGVLPKMNSVAFYRYAYPSVELAFILLAAVGIDQMAAWTGPRRRVAAPLGLVFVLLVVAVWQAHGLVVRLNGDAGPGHWELGSIVWALIILLAAEALLLLRVRWVALGLAALLVIDAGVMFGLHELSAPRQVRLRLGPVTYLQRHLGNQRFFTLGPIQPEYGGYWGVASINTDDLPIPKRWAGFIQQRLDPVVHPTNFVGSFGGARSPLLPTPTQQLIRYLGGYRAASVSYVVTPAGQTLPRKDGFHLAFADPAAWIYHLQGSSPYFSTAVGCTQAAYGRLRVRVSCPHTTTLVRRELSFPGWSARIDGRAVPVRAAGIFQQITVPAGTHTVTFAYVPPHMLAALAAFLFGLGWVGVGMIGPTRIRRPGRRRSPPKSASVTGGPRS